MFVRWQSRQRNHASFGSRRRGDTHWRAIVVESARVNGKPTQRHVAYLIGFTESAIKIDAQRCHIWDKISERLDQLHNQITPDDRQKIEEAIALKMQRPSAAEYKEIARDCVRLLGWEWISDKQRTALQDEAEQWQGGEGDLIGKIRGAAAATR
jgi:hypothetical protein